MLNVRTRRIPSVAMPCEAKLHVPRGTRNRVRSTAIHRDPARSSNAQRPTTVFLINRDFRFDPAPLPGISLPRAFIILSSIANRNEASRRIAVHGDSPRSVSLIRSKCSRVSYVPLRSSVSTAINGNQRPNPRVRIRSGGRYPSRCARSFLRNRSLKHTANPISVRAVRFPGLDRTRSPSPTVPSPLRRDPPSPYRPR